jgi:hypothetical protein
MPWFGKTRANFPRKLRIEALYSDIKLGEQSWVVGIQCDCLSSEAKPTPKLAGGMRLFLALSQDWHPKGYSSLKG